ncbi:hypothetical protein FPV67DRAFT_1432500 [Lyophyllum atratum]|nr:hypothetical protein FPV67DRAFT_1432500 [Lyophyllum atratum]
MQRRPASEFWLQNPGWIDGAVNPPQFYTSHEEMNATLIAYGRPPRPLPLQAVRDALASLSDNAGLAASATTSEAPGSQAVSVEAPACNADPSSHLVTVVMAYSAPVAPTTRNAKPTTKKTRTNKAKNISIEGTTRVEFIKACLSVHDIAEKFSPGVHSGPDFMLWWPGGAGGKTGAPTISTDDDFNTVVVELLAKDKKKKSLTHVSVEFDVDKMEGFRIKQPAPWDEANTAAGEEELAYGTRVPQVGMFSEASQINGNFILMLKQKWKCDKHLGEHGEPGFCYTTPDHGHLPLNHLRFRTWAAAMAAGNCTKKEPPNAPEFDGVRDGTLLDTRPRGRNGPYPAASAPSTPAAPDMSALLGVATVALLKDLTRRKRRRHYSSSPPSSPPRANTAPPRAYSPIPLPHLELTTCLDNFKTSKFVDLTMHETALAKLELTPAIIPQVPVARLCEIMHIPEGRVHKLQLFCREWQARLEEKSSHLNKKPRLD